MKNKLIHSHRQGLGTCGKPADPPEDGDDKTTSAMVVYIFEAGKEFQADLLFLKHACSIFRQSSNPVLCLSIMEQARLCAVWPTENWVELFHEPHRGLLAGFIWALVVLLTMCITHGGFSH